MSLRINPILLEKFQVAIGFENVSASITAYMQKVVREFEAQYWVIPVGGVEADTKYDIITRLYWVQINRKEFDKLLKFYPKTRKWIYIKSVW